MSVELQKHQWASLEKHIDGQIAQLRLENVKVTALGLFEVNILRGRGLFCRVLIDNLLQHPEDLDIFASLAGILAFSFEEIGRLLVARSVALVKKFYTENSTQTQVVCEFLCELLLQRVVSVGVLLQIFQLLLEKSPTDEAVDLAIHMLNRVGGYLDKEAKPAVSAVFDRLRGLLQDRQTSPQTHTNILAVLQSRRDGLRLQIDSRLNVIDTGEQDPVFVQISEKQNTEPSLNYFQVSDDFDAEEADYRVARDEILEYINQEQQTHAEPTKKKDLVVDMTDEQLLDHQKNIYLTVMSSVSADEAVHKLAKLKKAKRLDDDVMADMIVKCNAQEKTYLKYFGVIGEKFCKLSDRWAEVFGQQFEQKYNSAHQFEGAQLRNMGKFFGHLLATDAVEFNGCLGHIRLTEEDTTSAGRVFIKFLFQQLVEELGIKQLREWIDQEDAQVQLDSLMPRVDLDAEDSDRLMFSINFFTAIGLGVLTEDMRSLLNNLPQRGRKRDREGGSSREPSRSYSRSASRSRSFSRSP